MSVPRGTVVIVGGGVVGAACAYYLNQSGWQVTVVDQGEFGKGCSHGNCGLITPSHALPLAEPGAVAKTLKAMVSKSAPFVIKPRLDPALWTWLYHFARRCNQQTMLADGHACHALLQSSRSLYDELMRDVLTDCEWETRGLLFAYRTRAAMDDFAATNELLHAHFNLGAVRYDSAALAAFEPALKPGLPGGWFYSGDAQLRPDRLMAAWKRVLGASGVTLRERCPVRGIVHANGRARALATAEGSLDADAVVMAAGALTPVFAHDLGCRIPIQPGKGYSMTMPRPRCCPRVPLIFPEHKVAVTPMQSGYRLGSTMEFAGYDATLNRRRLELLRSGASLYLQEPYCDPVEEEWCGWRPMTYDSKPIIGPSPALSNVWIAAGHNMLGVSMSPATGKLIAELVGGTAPHLDPAPYAATRF